MWFLQSSRWFSSELLAPRASLVLSDYSEPLTLGNLRSMGPDRYSGCAVATVARFQQATLATWQCAQNLPLSRREVYFYLKDGKISHANYSEADMASVDPI
jgi:hypothetical protein